MRRLTFPCTTACSPYTITLPGAETIKAGIMGLDVLRSRCCRGPGVSRLAASMSSLRDSEELFEKEAFFTCRPFVVCLPFVMADGGGVMDGMARI
jgi:hypothetical protein